MQTTGFCERWVVEDTFTYNITIPLYLTARAKALHFKINHHFNHTAQTKIFFSKFHFLQPIIYFTTNLIKKIQMRNR